MLCCSEALLHPEGIVSVVCTFIKTTDALTCGSTGGNREL